jgi:hypothetical protein
VPELILKRRKVVMQQIENFFPVNNLRRAQMMSNRLFSAPSAAVLSDLRVKVF